MAAEAAGREENKAISEKVSYRIDAGKVRIQTSGR